MKRLMLIFAAVLLLSSCLGPNVGNYRVKAVTREEIQLDQVEKWATENDGTDSAIIYVGDKNYEAFVQLANHDIFKRLDVKTMEVRMEGEQLVLEIEDEDLAIDPDDAPKYLHITSRGLPAPKEVQVFVGEESFLLQTTVFE